MAGGSLFSDPPASEYWTPPQPLDQAALPWLLAPSSPPWAISPPALPGSIIPPALPWPFVNHTPPWDSIPRATPHLSGSVRLLLSSHSTFVLCSFGSTTAFQIPTSTSVSGAICLALALRDLPVALAHRLSVSASGSTTTCTPTVGWPPGAISSSSTLAFPSVGSTMGHHHGCGLGPGWLLQVPLVSSLVPSSI